MVPTRRSFLIGGAGVTLCYSLGMAAQADDWRREIEVAIANNQELTLGSKVPLPNDPIWIEARNELAKAAKYGVPYKIAEYFTTSNFPSKFRNAIPEPDPRNPTPTNPVIFLLFVATKTKPVGDKTAWCAAFVNWCLSNATSTQKTNIQGTNSASSQSFIDQKWGEEVWSKRRPNDFTKVNKGDIVVFRWQDDPMHGHVGFFSQRGQGNLIEVLGGNQIRNGLHQFNVTQLNMFGPLELISIRTAKGLRDGTV